ncbi:MAG: hypothetical protein N2109_13570, partial [Fimbriimonadales bacterium]|nr:hypothetical protein [Fimbriimonadales bacterium]
GRESTATEQNIKFQAFQLGATDDITALTPGLKRLALVCMDMLKANFPIWHPVYADRVGVESVEEMDQPLVIELSGKSPADSPQLQSEQAQMLLQLAMTAPQLGIDPMALIKTIVMATSLPNKDEILRNFENQQAQVAEAAQNGQLEGILQQLAMAGVPGLAALEGIGGAPGAGEPLPDEAAGGPVQGAGPLGDAGVYG